MPASYRLPRYHSHMLDISRGLYLCTLGQLWRLIRLTLLLLCGLGASAIAWSQSAVVTTAQVRAELVAHAPNGVQAGQALWVGLQLQHQPEWHTYWRNPGDSGLPTQLEWNLPAGVQAGPIAWPLPSKLRAGSLTNYGYDQQVLLVVPLTLSREFKASPTLDIRLHANWLVCRLECIPQEGDFQLRIPTHSSHAPLTPTFEAVIAQQPRTVTPTQTETQFDVKDQTQFITLRISSLPAALQGHRLAVFPETPEILESATEQHPMANQSWQGAVWTAKLPLSSLRQTSPSTLPLLLVDGQGAQRQGFSIDLPLTHAWPPLPDGPIAPPTNTPRPPQTVEVGLWGFALALAGAFIGGLILNLMPCVLPILAIKVLSFAQHSRQHRAHRIAGLAYTAGVVLSFLLLGAGVLALRAAGEQLGWGFQLQSPMVVSALAVLFTLIALNLWGLFELGHVLPSAWLSFQARHPVSDALLSGVLAVAVASPCTAPFMGASLGLAMTLPIPQALAIFASMGLGLALPYLAASWWPAVARRLPHPGPWMVMLRQLLAFPMLATVVWLLWVLGQQTSLDASTLLLAWLLGLSALVWSTRFRTHSGRLLQLIFVLALGLAGASWLPWLNDAPDSAPNTLADSSTSASSTWQDWSEAEVAQSLARNQPVFVDFTAAWCVTCQINKKTTLGNPAVLSDFQAHQVRLLRADWTRRDPAITAALNALGRSGVPVYVLYAPGRAPLVLSELLSTSQIHEALAALPSTQETPITAKPLPNR